MSTFLLSSFFLAWSTCVLVPTGVTAGVHEDRLISHIFTQRNYNSLSRPVEDEADSLTVTFGVDIQQIIDVDEKNEMLHTNLWLHYQWDDWNLKWNPEEYGGVKEIRLPWKSVWTPDILLYNSADEDIDSKYPVNVVVNNNGTCTWIPLGLYISSCSIDIKWFPFDEQICKMKFGSWTYDGTRINLTNKEDAMENSTYQESGEWILVEAPAVLNTVKYPCCPDQPYLDITFSLHIKRRTLYYGFNLIIPCFLISFLSLLTFILPPDAGEKIGLGVTVLLSLSVFQMIVAEMVPPTSMAVPIVGMYFACVMLMSTVSVIMTVIVLHLHHSTPDMCKMPAWIRTGICEWLAWILRMSRPGKELTLEKLLRKASVRELEERVPPSLSLLANVEDIDNTIQLNKLYFRHNRNPDDDDGAGLSIIRNEVLLILNEIRFITKKMKDDSKASEETNDWKFAAMVVDRLCFWICTAYFVSGTIGIFFSVPNFFG